MTKIVDKGKSYDQIKKDDELAEKNNKIMQENEKIHDQKRGIKIFQEWRTKKCNYCETIFNIENEKDIETETVYGGSRVNRYDKYVKCPNCKKRVSLGDIPRDLRFPPSKFSKYGHYLWYLSPLFGILGGIIGYFFLKDDHREMAEHVVILGLLVSIIYYILGFY